MRKNAMRPERMQFCCALLFAAMPMTPGAGLGSCYSERASTCVSSTPFVVPRGGSFWVAYEVDLARTGERCRTPIALQVLDAGTRVGLAELPVDRELGAHRIYVDLDLREAPRRLAHRIRFEECDGSSTEEEGPAADVVQASMLLSPPVPGGWWIAVYDPKLPRGHRRYAYTEGGEDYIPGRYAIDWFATTEDGSVHRGDGTTLGQWHGFGLPVLAVADAEVVEVRDGYLDRAPHAAFEDGPGTGNLVVLRLGRPVCVLRASATPQHSGASGG